MKMDQIYIAAIDINLKSNQGKITLKTAYKKNEGIRHLIVILTSCLTTIS